MKILFGAADLSIVWLLSRFDGGLYAAALYGCRCRCSRAPAWNTSTPPASPCSLAALLYLKRSRPVAAGVAFALSLMTKFFSGFAALALARRGGMRFAAAGLVVASAIWAMGTGGGATPAAGLSNFATRWSGNSILYPAIESAIDRAQLLRGPRRRMPAGNRHAGAALDGETSPSFYPEPFARRSSRRDWARFSSGSRLGSPDRSARRARRSSVPPRLARLHPVSALGASLRRAVPERRVPLPRLRSFGYALLHPVALLAGLVLALEHPSRRFSRSACFGASASSLRPFSSGERRRTCRPSLADRRRPG